MIRIFLAGIIQGSLQEAAVHSQDYRTRIKELLTRYVPDARLYCPVENHPASLGYTDRQGREVFLDHVEMAATCDVLLAYVPDASMGTAVEMWEANRNGRVVLTISPLADNWTIKFLSTKILRDLEEFADFLADGGLQRLLNSHPPRTEKER